VTTGGESTTGAAEERLMVLLEVLRADATRPDESIDERVMRTARWQYLVRGVLSVLNDLAALLVDGVILMLGLRRPSRAA
jgi:hypothetical protein